MLKVFGSKKGFTLVELLIVMFIIAVLVTLSVGGYTAYRKAALIDLNADLLVSQIDEMRDKTIHGTQFGDSLKCFGLKFSKADSDSEGLYEMMAVSYGFTDRKVWNPVSQKWEYEGCGVEDVTPLIFEMDPMVNVESIEIGEGSNFTEFTADNLAFRFVPPDGNIEVVGQGIGGNILVKLRYGNGVDQRYSRTVSIDLTTGKIVKN